MKLFLRSFGKRWQNWLALLILATFFLVALFAPVLSPPEDPLAPSPFKLLETGFDRLPHPPDAQNPLGTVVHRQDVPLFGVTAEQQLAIQIDVYHTLIWGTRSALRFGLTVTGITAVLGIFIGLVSGYFGGWVSQILLRLTDGFLTFPVVAAVWLLQIVVYSRLDPAAEGAFSWQRLIVAWNITPVMLALILFSWMPYARLINTNVEQLMANDFILAAKAMGATPARIILRHLLPNSIAPAVVLAARDVGGFVILESAFTFIGISSTVAWGVILVSGRAYIIGIGGNPFAYWWVFVPISSALILFSVGWNLLGDGLHQQLNPFEP